MTVGLLNVGVSGLRAAQVQLEVTGSNIANVDTPGFARRSAIQTSISSGGARTLTGGEDTGGGIGVRIDRIQRSYDQFLIGDLRSTAGGAAGLGAEAEWQVELERAIGTRDTGVAGGLARFLDSAERLAAAPTSLPLRRDMLAAGADVAAGFRETAARFARIDDGIVADLGGALTSANQALESLADINRQLARTEDGSATATTLLDRRDSALDALAAELPISVEYLPQGRVGVRLANANGPKLIGEGQLSTLGLGEPGADGLPTLLVDANFAPRLVTIPDGGRAGARVGGLFAALAATRDAVDALDGLAADTATLANDAHRAGVDLAGDAGLALFTAADGTPVVSAADMDWAIDAPERLATAGAVLADGITPTPADRDDNRNLLALIDTIGEPLTARITDQRGRIVTASAAAQDRAGIASAAAADTRAAYQNRTGVNLDEEAANLIRFQQGYEAAARVIQAARETFDSLLNIR